MSERNEWVAVGEEMPDADRTVLIAYRQGRAESVWLGYHDGERWRDVDGTDLQKLETHWRDLPAGPGTGN